MQSSNSNGKESEDQRREKKERTRMKTDLSVMFVAFLHQFNATFGVNDQVLQFGVRVDDHILNYRFDVSLLANGRVID
jgi:hypothetical protein